jgi:hypothetical protein
VTFSAEGLDMVMHSEGVYAGDAYRCETNMDFGGFAFTLIGLGTPETTWLDAGDGFIEVSALDPDLDTATGICPANPTFWADGAFAAPGAEGEPDVVNGIPAQRLDLSEFMAGLSGFGFDMQGMEFEEATMWISDDGGWVVAFDMTFSVAPGSAEEFFGPGFEISEPAEMHMVMQIANPNDPSLAVEVPPTQGGKLPAF